MIERIRQRIQENMECSHLEILDESPSHGGYDGSVSHIKIIVVSDEFIDQSDIDDQYSKSRISPNIIYEKLIKFLKWFGFMN